MCACRHILLVSLLLGPLPPLATARAGELPFAAASSIAAIGVPQDTEVADIDGDGDLDAVVATNSNGLYWYENVGGTATTWTQRTIGTGISGLFGLVVVDVNADGALDVLQVGGSAAWWRNNGGSWTQVSIPGAPIGYLVPGDIDADGDIDFVGANPSGGFFSWHENTNAIGTAWSTHFILTFVSGANSVAVADVNGDGWLDVAGTVGGSNDIIMRFFNDGTPAVGEWTWITISSAYNDPVFLRAGDVDGDGDADFVSSIDGSGTDVVWHENLGFGSSWADRAIANNLAYGPEIDLFDVDLDGDLDVLFASDHPSDSGVGWYENDGTPGGLGDWSTNMVDGTKIGPRTVFAGDLDWDGHIDVASTAISYNSFEWYRSQAIHRSATFPAGTDITGGIAFDVDTADFDGDGYVDIVASNGSRVMRSLNVFGDGSAWNTHIWSVTSTALQAVEAADIDGDGDQDLLWGANAAMGWTRNDGGFNWQPVTIDTGKRAVQVRAADIDGDGDLDAVGSTLLSNIVTWYENDGTPDDPSEWTERLVTPSGFLEPLAIETADIDGDGDVDVVVANTHISVGRISWFENVGGAGTTWSEHLMATPLRTRNLYAEDMNRDGHVDIVFSNYDNTLYWLLNDGTPASGGWAYVTVATLFRARDDARPVDMDLDGDPDLVVTDDVNDRVRWFENANGLGTAWSSHGELGGLATPVAVATADFDGDRLPDIVYGGYNGGGELAVYLNRGGQFALATTGSSAGYLFDGAHSEVLRIDASHRGRAGDDDAELAALELLFEEAPADPLSSGEANALVDSLTIYRDDGSGVYEAGIDTFVTVLPTLSLVSGVQTLTLPDGHPELQIGPGLTNTYFVVVTATADAGAQTPNSVEITHVTEASSSAEHSDVDSALLLEFAANVAEGPVAFLDGTGDEDLDGLSNSDEVNIHGTNPNDADSDDDGLDDGAEVALGTDPNDADDDDDGICDGSGTGSGGNTCTAGPDNCPFVDNPLQENNDGSAQGDACQCGDVTNDGVIDTADITSFRAQLVGASGGGTFIEERCNVVGPRTGNPCQVDDIFVLERFVAGVAVVVGIDCHAYGP